MARVKILFHDNCFDGAASAGLFQRFYASKLDSSAAFVFAGKAHGTGNVYQDADFDGDVNVVVDFRYSANPRLDWWFDHHVSGFPTAKDETHFEERKTSGSGAHLFFDPTRRSCSKYLADVARDHFGWDNAPYAELIMWADIIDGAQFESPKVAVELAEPALQLMTWVENNQDVALKTRFINDLTTKSLTELSHESYITTPLQPILQRHKRALDIVRDRIVLDRGVVFFDVADEGIEAYNKFIPYFLHPECRYVVSVSQTPTRTKVSVGSNPWNSARRSVNIAEVCERYGGGGHPVVGAVSLKANDLPRARQIAAEIVELLRVAVVAEG